MAVAILLASVLAAVSIAFAFVACVGTEDASASSENGAVCFEWQCNVNTAKADMTRSKAIRKRNRARLRIEDFADRARSTAGVWCSFFDEIATPETSSTTSEESDNLEISTSTAAPEEPAEEPLWSNPTRDRGRDNIYCIPPQTSTNFLKQTLLSVLKHFKHQTLKTLRVNLNKRKLSCPDQNKLKLMLLMLMLLTLMLLLMLMLEVLMLMLMLEVPAASYLK